MEISIYKKVTEYAKYLECWINPRYWEDAQINGEEDNRQGTLARRYLPKNVVSSYYDYDNWLYIKIDLDDGTVCDWPEGVDAQFYYKSCDINRFRLLDANSTLIHETEGTEYVIGPKFMNDCGDYFCMEVDVFGNIKHWDSNKMQDSLSEWANIYCDN